MKKILIALYVVFAFIMATTVSADSPSKDQKKFQENLEKGKNGAKYFKKIKWKKFQVLNNREKGTVIEEYLNGPNSMNAYLAIAGGLKNKNKKVINEIYEYFLKMPPSSAWKKNKKIIKKLQTMTKEKIKKAKGKEKESYEYFLNFLEKEVFQDVQ